MSLELINFIREGEKFLIAGHKEPDGDCIGSQLALASVLRRMGKKTILCSAGPFKRTEIKPYKSLFTSVPDENDRAGARVIVLDCPSLDRTGTLQQYLEGLPLAVIDHHEAGNKAAEMDKVLARYIDEKAYSTTILVKKLIEALGLELERDEAEFLFLGLCTDTGFFRHVDSDGSEVFETTVSLIRSGANPKAAYFAMYGGKSFGSRRLVGHMLVNAEALFDGKLILSTEEYEHTCLYGHESRDSEALYQLLQSITGVEAIVLLRQETPERCTVGLRSRAWVDVGHIAESFGGGGHQNAAGFTYAGIISILRPKIISAFENIFYQSNR